MVDREEEYGSLSSKLGLMGVKTESLIRELLIAESVRVLDVTHRVKSEVSAKRKIEARLGTYASFIDLHDMLGVRVITYLESDVARVISVLRDNFQIDEERSLDKQSDLDPDRFGYLSHHLVVSAHSTRESLAEWQAFRGIYFEIQVRSILQHAWAEIEHDLGYKSAVGVPAHIRRRFARLAGLLELADHEFDGVSTEVAEHVTRVASVIETGGNLAIDRDSIQGVTASSGVVSRADKAIAIGIGASLETEVTTIYADSRAEEMAEIGLHSIKEVNEAIEENFDSIVRFAVNWLNRPDRNLPFASLDSEDIDNEGRYTKLPPGISLFYLYLHKRLQGPGDGSLFGEMLGLDDLAERDAFLRVHDEAFES